VQFVFNIPEFHPDLPDKTNIKTVQSTTRFIKPSEMKFLYFFQFKTKRLCLIIGGLLFFGLQTYAQNATVAIPIGLGSLCTASGSANDSVKYFNYNSATNLLSYRSVCQPKLVSPGFNKYAASITFNPFDGRLYYTRYASAAGVFNSYTYRWFPTACPNILTQPVYKTFPNQIVAGVEFDPTTGMGYQINFVDSTGYPPANLDAGNVGTFTSSAIVNGFPAVSYYDAAGGNLKYVRATDANGTTWGTPVTIATTGTVGQYTSLTVVNGNPAISYYDASNGDLKYVRSIDANGNIWSTPVTVESANNVGQFTSLVIVNGNPAISYYDVTNADLRYTRSNDVNGAVWGTPVAIATAGNTGQYTSMSIVGGNPAISYYDVTNGDLLYVAAGNANGTLWGTPITVDATNNVGAYTSLKIINGNPAIAYNDITNGDLRYARASNAAGTAWAVPVIVEAANNIGQYPSLITANGNPAISYYDVTNLDLRYVRAGDANGTSWGTSIAITSTGNIGQYTSVSTVNGNPAVFYFDATNGALKYIRANDVNGNLWYKKTGIYKLELQQVDFITGTLGISQPINFGSRYIYQQSGDLVMTPGKQMLAVFDNKYITINWKDYGTAVPLVATFIDSLKLGNGNDMVGLAYSDGKLVGSVYNNTICNSSYKEIDILTGALSPITYGAGSALFPSSDMTDITSGIGAAKKLISATENPVGSKTYDVVYEVFIKNFGGTPLTNLQAYDTLTQINGAANVLSSSITSISAPSGITKNTLFDGKTAGNFSLFAPGSTLSNLPGQNIITLQITCKIAGIQPGIVYFNQVAANGVGLFGDNVRDLSTDGGNPDLNLNDRPDDTGENQPTPLLISVTAQTPPCASLTNILYSQDFGTGNGLTAAIPAPVTGTGATLPVGNTFYTSSITQPISTETYTITDNVQNANTGDFLSITDHTGNANGRMLVINADASNTILYQGSFQSSFCANQQYSLSFYAAFPGNAAYQTKCNAFGGFQYPKIKIRVRDGATGLIITQVSTPDITGTAWQQFGLKFISPASYSSLIFELVNDAPGGCGNDVMLDDIQFGSCDALPVVNVSAVSAGCLGTSTTFVSSLSDPAALPGSKDYQWQISTALAGPYTDIAGANTATYTIASIAAADTGKYYRLVIAATGNLGNPSCRYTSPANKLPGKFSSVAATSATKNKNNICPGITVSLGITGGTLGYNANWQWYSGSCGGTLVGTGAAIAVMPAVTTTYFVRAEGDCNNTACQQVTVFVSCNIDQDRDGIPNFVESNLPVAMADANGNGIINAYDATYPGFTDNNNNFINDSFEPDGDSDNDGIPNYLDTSFPGRIDINSDGIDDRFDTDKDGIINMLDLDSENDGIPDVVEAGGVDTNGDGIIDNFTDADGDWLTDQVDANLSGAYNSGIGLGLIDIDGDGVPDYIDLDSDNDGIPDTVEAGATDANSDGKPDNFTDAGGDGLHDGYVYATALLKTGDDLNNDGRADTYPFKNMDNDRRANPYDCDSDGDGIVDVIEAGFADINFDGWIDGTVGTDGWSTVVRAKAALNLRNTDGRGNPDYLDIDADDDGIPDNIEGMTTKTYLLPSNIDTDNDGIDNSYDSRVGYGAPGIFVCDSDGDSTPDYRDTDSDADGALDIVEGNDFNLNGLADDNVTLTLMDTDGDGLDNRFDSVNSAIIVKGTSFNMGNGGTYSGDPTPGGRTPVQQTLAGAPDRDWRSVGVVLNVSMLTLSGSRQGNDAALVWKVVTSDNIDRFEIERSISDGPFATIAVIKQAIKLNEMQSLGYTDNTYGIFAEKIMYRVKLISKSKGSKYSNIFYIRQTRVKKELTISPNPSKNYVNVSFTAEKAATLEIRLLDNNGKMVLLQKQIVNKGINNIKLINLNNYEEGVYTIQTVLDGELTTRKIMLLTNK
jgi:Secretion system C-terminal sorting domain/Ig-like domain CHU_C associated